MRVVIELDAPMRAMLAITLLKPCCLCGGSGDGVGIFIPNQEHADAYGAPAGKERLIAYPICESCCDDARATERVEALLRRSEFCLMRRSA